MKNMIDAQFAVEKLHQETPVAQQDKTFKRKCHRLATAAAYRDLEDIHKEIAHLKPGFEDADFVTKTD